MSGRFPRPFRGREVLVWGEQAPPHQTGYCKQLAYWNLEILPKYCCAFALISTSEPEDSETGSVK